MATLLLSVNLINENAATLKKLRDNTIVPLNLTDYEVMLSHREKKEDRFEELFDIEIEGFEINNLPQDISIQLIPKDITILFDVSMDEFNEISSSDFIVICDFDKKNDQENFMIPQLLKKPESIQNFEFKENKVKYLVFK